MKAAADLEVASLTKALQKSENELSTAKSQVENKDNLLQQLRETSNKGTTAAEIELENVKKQLSEATLTINKSNELADQLRDSIESQKQSSSEEITTLSETLASKELLLTQLQEASSKGNSAAETEASNLKQQLSDKQTLIEELKEKNHSEIEALKKQLNDLQKSETEAGSLKGSISSLEEKLKSEQAKNTSLEETLRESKEQITTLTAKVEDLSFFEEMQGSASTETANLEQQLQDSALKIKSLELSLDAAQNDFSTARENLKKQELAAASNKRELAAAQEQISVLENQVQTVTETSQKKFEKFKIMAKDQHTSAQEQIEASSSEIERIREKATSEIRKRTIENQNLRESMAEQQEKLSTTSELLSTKEQELDDALLRIERLTEQITSAEQQYELKLEEERREVESTLQDRVEAVTVEYSLKLEEAAMASEKDLLESRNQVQQTRKEMKAIQETLIKEKEKQAALSQLEITKLQNRVLELEKGGDGASSRASITPPAPSPNPRYENVTSVQRELGQSMMLLAQQQANRDSEMQSLTSEIARLTEINRSVSTQRDDLQAKLNSLDTTQSERIASANRTKLNMDYLKNILVKFLSEGNKTVQAGLVPVIVTMLELTNAEKTGIRKIFPSAKV
eukprot:TRINITY_DN9487_c0_g1_i1.p1 TRINITY_DN9487_c0_g1~~TRINITY_DN9487_c0_g1_i1.p1  ORF type:complete len:631 (+),score=188.13 TRINITY_DN9487_c0_g1_i1:893-2785(+)